MLLECLLSEVDQSLITSAGNIPRRNDRAAQSLTPQFRPQRTSRYLSVPLARDPFGTCRLDRLALHRRIDFRVLFIGSEHWNWTGHRATSEYTLLFQLTDREVLARRDYLREEFRD